MKKLGLCGINTPLKIYPGQPLLVVAIKGEDHYLSVNILFKLQSYVSIAAL
ncbi:transposase [Psychrobacter sp. 1501(2011)]|nr:transposase [Psychrobacter sp. 1501(2011)]